MAAKSKPNEISITRIYAAHVKAVWDAWTDPKQAAKWWGPRGFTITTHSKELRVGGHWHYTMHGPDGVDYPNKTKFFEVEKYARLVYDHGGNDEQAPLFRVTVDFSDVKGATKMEMSMALPTPEAAEETRKFVKKAGGDSTWDRLAEYLEKESSGKEQFFINRSFDAPVDVVYEMWTNPKHFSKWMAPTGMNMEFIKADIRVGGESFFCMSGSGLKLYGKMHCLEMRGPNGLVYTQQFADEKANVSRHPMAPTWPETMKATVTITEEAPNKTRITVMSECYGKTSSEELQAFIAEKAGMTGGWTGSFDKLEAYLAEQA